MIVRLIYGLFHLVCLSGWQALIQEDRLISRLAAMESHLSVQAKLWHTASGKEATSALDENTKQVKKRFEE